MTDQLSLAAEFEPATLDQWRRLALGVLRKSGVAGADGRSASSRVGEDTPPEAVDDLLSTTTYDGIRIAPLYPPAPRAASTATAGWDVRQRHGGTDPGAVRNAIVDDLEGGTTSIWLDLHPGGWAADDPADLGTALSKILDGFYLDLAGIVLDAGPAGADAAATALLRIAADRGTPATGNLGLDPCGWAARGGDEPDLAPAVAWARRCAAEHPTMRSLTVDATPYHEAGGSDAQELGVALATGVAYLRALTDAGLSIDAALGQLEFRYAASADQFLTISKFRAARRTWARVARACGAAPAEQRQHAVTSAAMMTARDPWVNMLRTTLACFGAGIGGADAVTVTPFDAVLGRPDSFGRRIARNTQSLLLDEAHLGRVADPAGGSGYVEALTDDLAQAAWDFFQEIERTGGIGAALSSGLVQQRLAQTWTTRADNIAHRRDAIVGVSEFPNLTEVLPSREPIRPVPSAGGLPRHRYAEAFESLRDAADAHAAATGARPLVTVAALGSPAANSARVAFARNLFAAGGVETVVVPAAEATGSVVCLCGPDKEYEAAAELAGSLRANGVEHVWLAGRPASYEGIDSYVYTGCDAVAVLEQVHGQLGVAS
jgi:methylmalonyl-CoA mutase